MKSWKAKMIMAVPIYLPFLILILGSLIFDPLSRDKAFFFRGIGWAFFLLSIFYLAFLILLKFMHEKITAYYIAVFLFILFVFQAGVFFNAIYTAPNFSGLIQNIYLIPFAVLTIFFGIIIFLILLTLFFMGIDNKKLIWVFLGMIIFSHSIIFGKELYHRHIMGRFFGDYKDGGIVFNETFTINNRQYLFSLLDRKFKDITNANFEKKVNMTPQKRENNAFQEFIASEYAYDRDDLSKIFITNRKTGETILLASGENPVWVESIAKREEKQ
ncbi:MAG: hypothetical protein FD145_1594 [Candidatus Saganbacteria bacterium]|uniref:Uncharacterized protein n=1 Tax=Candidatus Saganbacteria bacterium TaxID=2575572 RepID=A0A833KZL4_UNCSA|nr:MAG: hypothetical protein FD145_1594 [Candidatus Saganbacteria bacterium]